MNTKNARILVIGAGVNGSICAVGLYRAGFDVTVLARAKRYEELVQQGIVIENPIKNTRNITLIPVIDALAADDRYESILVIIRKNQVPDLLPVLARNCSPNVVFMINNPSGPDIYTEALGAERVLSEFRASSQETSVTILLGLLSIVLLQVSQNWFYRGTDFSGKEWRSKNEAHCVLPNLD
jgi:2-dehydropantoate 2-reductase